VLPFHNARRDPSLDYIVDGITEGIAPGNVEIGGAALLALSR